MSKSTKSRRVGAFTGEKGIGFKATAVVSECTYISSNGYDFCFDMRLDAFPVEALGLVCPRWEEDLAANMQAWVRDRAAGLLPDNLLDGFGTRIWLQLKPQCDIKGLVDQLRMLDPFMLLNLRKLREMKVIVMAGNPYHRTFSKSVVATNSSQINIRVEEGPIGDSVTVSTRHLVCLRQSVEVPQEVAASEKKRAGVGEVEFVFALPVTEDGSAAPDVGSWLFAFLPVKPYGFRFPIQADFVLPSTREGILEDRLWNQWMRDQLAPVLVQEAMAALRTDQQLSQQQHKQQAAHDRTPSISSAMLLQYIPLHGDVQDEFLGKAAAEMLKLLKLQPCILTESGQLAEPSCTLLPSKLLQRPDGRPLISNEWLMQGLPGVEYVHPSVLADSRAAGSRAAGSRAAGSRAAAVLRQLGAKDMDSGTLVSWLQADGTYQLLQQLALADRTEWLKDLYCCLNSLLMQLPDSCLSMADVSTWGPRLATAPILQLFGSQQLLSKNAAGQHLYIWDRSLGNTQAMELFSSSNTDTSSAGIAQLQFLDLSTLNTDSAALVQRLLGLKPVQPAHLIHHFLESQHLLGCANKKHQQQLLFFFKIRSKLGMTEQSLSSSLRLRIGAANCKICLLVNETYVPLSACRSGIPAALADDLTAAGVSFLHAQYVDCAQEPTIQDSSEFWGWLRRLGVRDLTRAEAAKHLLSLYECSHRNSITQQQHMQHIRFVAAAYAEGHVQQEQLPSLYIYSEQQSAAAAPAAACSQLQWPLARWCSSITLAHNIESQLRAAGSTFVHSCYYEDLENEGKAVQSMLAKAGVQQPHTLLVVQKLLELHHSPKRLQEAAQELSLTVQDLLLQQLEYLAGRYSKVHSAVHDKLAGLCQELFLLQSSSGQWVLSRQLHLPPVDTNSAGVLTDLAQSGCGLQLVAAEVVDHATDDVQQLVLTKLLGVKKADTATILRAMAQLHSRNSTVLTLQQRMHHLGYLSHHTSRLQEDADLLSLVQQSVLLPSSLGNYYRADQLFFPLGSHLDSLQEDVDAAGMQFLDSSLTSDSSISSAGVNENVLHNLLMALGVRHADESKVVEHILKLHGSDDKGDMTQHVAHVEFIASNWQKINDSTKALVRKRLLLRSQPAASHGSSSNEVPGSSSSSGGVSGVGGTDINDSMKIWAAADSMYQLPAHNSPEWSLLETMQLAGLQFLHPMYSSGEEGPWLLLWMRNNLGLRSVTPTKAASAIMKCLNLYVSDSQGNMIQHLAHIRYLAVSWHNIDAATQSCVHTQLRLRIGESASNSSGADDSVGIWAHASNIYQLPAHDSPEWNLLAAMQLAGLQFLHPMYASGEGYASVLQWLRGNLRLRSVDPTEAASAILRSVNLYVSDSKDNMTQHLAHVKYIAVNWHNIGASTQSGVREQLRLRIQEPVSNSIRSSGSDGSIASKLHQLPAVDSPEWQLLNTMQLSGLQFLHPMYESSTNDQIVVQWLRNQLQLQVVTPSVATSAILRCLEQSGDRYASVHSWQQVVDHAVYLSQHRQQIGRDALKKLKCSFPIGLQKVDALDVVPCRNAATTTMYWPSSGQDWQLQQVLLPSEVHYIHPDYAERAQQLESRAETRSMARKLRQFLEDLGILFKPVAELPELQRAIDAGDRWLPLLLLLAEQWDTYTAQQQQQLVQQLQCMQVDTSAGTTALQQCFMPMVAQQLPLVTELKVPLLEVPNPQLPHWNFLAQCGVSMSLGWHDLRKILQQLSSTQADPSSDSMQKLYDIVHGWCQLHPAAEASIKEEFAAQRLIFIPGAQGCRPQWVTSSDVLWSGRSKIFPASIFLKPKYKAQEAFFRQLLGVRDAGFEDLKAALLAQSQQDASTQQVIQATQLIYEELANGISGQPINWLPGLLSEQTVLLVTDRGNCKFVAASSDVYVPDDKQLVELFAGDCMLLQIPVEMVPAMQRLLQCIKPPLPLLSASIQRSFQKSAHSDITVQCDHSLTQLIQEVLPYAARCVYKEQPDRYRQLLESGELQRLWDLHVLKLPGLVEVLRLGAIEKLQPAVAAITQQEVFRGSEVSTAALMYVNGNCNVGSILLHAADKLVEELLGSCSSSTTKLSDLVAGLLRDLQSGDHEAAEATMEHRKYGQIPRNLRFWWVPEDASPSNSAAGRPLDLYSSQSGKQAWEDDSESEDGEFQLSESQLQQPIPLTRIMPPDTASSQEWVGDHATADSTESTGHAAASSRSGPQNGSSSSDSRYTGGTGWSGTTHERTTDYSSYSSYSCDDGDSKYQSSYSSGGSSATYYQQRTQSLQQRLSYNSARMTKSGTIEFIDSQAIDAVAGSATSTQDLQHGLQHMRTAAAAADSGFDPQALRQSVRAASPSSNAVAGTLHALAEFVPKSTAGPGSAITADVGSSSPPTSGGSESEHSSRGNAVVAKADISPRTGSYTASREITQELSMSTTITDRLELTADLPVVAAISPGVGWSSGAGGLTAQQEIGAMGEYFLHKLLQRTLPGFDDSCWRSGNRVHAGLAAPAEEPPFDFVYDDVKGVLCGVPGAKCFIECKATTYSAVEGRQARPILITAREWEFAQDLHHQQSAMYVIVRLEHVNVDRQPRVAAVLVDPVQLLSEGKLRITGQGLQLYGFSVA